MPTEQEIMEAVKKFLPTDPTLGDAVRTATQTMLDNLKSLEGCQTGTLMTGLGTKHKGDQLVGDDIDDPSDLWGTGKIWEEETQKLISLRRAQVLTIPDADTFLSQLEEKVHALDDISGAHPLSSKIAVATVKRYVADERHRVQLFDLVKEETERVYAALGQEHFPVQRTVLNGEKLADRCRLYRGVMGTLIDMAVTGCYWGKTIHEDTWVMSLQRVANPSRQRYGQQDLLDLRLYPALLLFYGASISAFAADRYSAFAKLVLKTRVGKQYTGHSLVCNLSLDSVMDINTQDRVFGKNRRHTSLSDHLFKVLRGPLRSVLSEDMHYENALIVLSTCVACFTSIPVWANASLCGHPSGGTGTRAATIPKENGSQT